MKRGVHECVAGKLEIVPLWAQPPSFQVISLVFQAVAVKKGERKENPNTHTHAHPQAHKRMWGSS